MILKAVINMARYNLWNSPSPPTPLPIASKPLIYRSLHKYFIFIPYSSGVKIHSKNAQFFSLSPGDLHPSQHNQHYHRELIYFYSSNASFLEQHVRLTAVPSIQFHKVLNYVNCIVCLCYINSESL